MEAAPPPAEPQWDTAPNPDLATLRIQNSRLRNEVQQLQQQRLAALDSRPEQAPAAASDSKGFAVNEEPAHQLAVAALQGDLKALEPLAEMVRTSLHELATNTALTDGERAAQTEKLLRPIWSAFELLAEEAAQGNENALRALAQAARTDELSGLSLGALGTVAGRGSEGALNVVLDPEKFGIDVPFSSTVSALKPAAEAGNPRAIDALAAIAANDSEHALWFLAADGLNEAATAGDSVAIDALISFSRSTNQNILNAVRAGLNGAAAHQNREAIEALRQIEARLSD